MPDEQQIPREKNAISTLSEERERWALVVADVAASFCGD